MPVALDADIDPPTRRRCCCTTISTAACGRRRSSSWRAGSATEALPTTDADELATWFREAANSGSLERYLETFAHTVAVMQTVDGITRVARECVEDLAADGVVYAEVRWAPEQHVDGGLTPRAGRRGGAGRLPRGRGGRGRGRRHVDPGRRDRHRDAARRALPRDRRARGALPRRRGGRLRHRRRRGRLPAHPAPGRVRVPAPRELPLHDPRRRGVRAAVDLGGDPVVRHRPARPRRAHRRRHHRRAAASAGWRSTCATSASRWRCARRPTCRPGRRSRSRSTRSGCCAGCSSGSRSTPTTG